VHAVDRNAAICLAIFQKSLAGMEQNWLDQWSLDASSGGMT
jgi:hypothetical protein